MTDGKTTVPAKNEEKLWKQVNSLAFAAFFLATTQKTTTNCKNCSHTFLKVAKNGHFDVNAPTFLSRIYKKLQTTKFA